MTETGHDVALQLEHRFEFHEDGDGTLVRLTHSGFANEELKGLHVQGWAAVLANLERNVSS
jgi:uncharacterized protein YndB with AHSA1/START domain